MLLRQTDELYTSYKLKAGDVICGEWIENVRTLLRDANRSILGIAVEDREARSDPRGTGREPPSSDPGILDDELRAKIEANPVLVMALREALDCGRYLVTVHRKVKDSPPDDLLGRSVMLNFPMDAVADSMQGLCRRILADEAKRLEFEQGKVAARAPWS